MSVAMLFDMRPKVGRHDLYGREAELASMLAALESATPLILLLGQRRIGKTSLLKTSLAEARRPYIYLDMRRLDEEGYSKVVLYRLLSEEMTRLNSTWKKLGEALKRVKGVQVAGTGIELDWSRTGLLLSSLFNSLDRWAEGNKVVVAIDEAQLLGNMIGGKGKIDFRSLIAYCYDNLRHVKFLLTGSEVGLLLDFVGADDPRNPLYGRGREEITLERFTREKSIGYLTAGFLECGAKADPNMFERATEKLDGIVGWLTLYGNLATSQEWSSGAMALESVMGSAKGMARSELESVFRRSKYYRMSLKSMGMGRTRWKDIKTDVSSWMGRPATDSQMARTLATLTKLSIVERKGEGYLIADPVIAEYAGGL